MKGLCLRSLRGELHKTHPRLKFPARTISNWEHTLGPWNEWITDRHGSEFDFLRDYHQLPLKILSRFSFDELCKLHYSTNFMMHSSVTDLFERQAQYEVVRKIQSSMWRWGMDKGTWNEIVDAYNHLRQFVLTEDPDFEIRLDHSTWFNPFGYSKYSRTFLDGVFAYLVYYKGKHVFTIGFSIVAGRKLLIQQVQSVQRSGNRALYKLPSNKLEFVIRAFRKNFKGYRLYVIDGNALVGRTLQDYRNGLERVRDRLERHTHSSLGESYLQHTHEEKDELEKRIAHLEADQDRIVAFYSDAGIYRFGSWITVSSFKHHEVL